MPIKLTCLIFILLGETNIIGKCVQEYYFGNGLNNTKSTTGINRNDLKVCKRMNKYKHYVLASKSCILTNGVRHSDLEFLQEYNYIYIYI